MSGVGGNVYQVARGIYARAVAGRSAAGAFQADASARRKQLEQIWEHSLEAASLHAPAQGARARAHLDERRSAETGALSERESLGGQLDQLRRIVLELAAARYGQSGVDWGRVNELISAIGALCDALGLAGSDEEQRR